MEALSIGSKLRGRENYGKGGKLWKQLEMMENMGFGGKSKKDCRNSEIWWKLPAPGAPGT